MTRTLRRLALVTVTAAALLAAAPAAPAAFASPPTQRVGDNNLQAPGAGLPLQVCVVCVFHGLAGVVPGTTGGRLSAVSINAGPVHLPGDGQLVVEVHDRDPLTDSATSGGPGALLATAVVPGDQLPTSPGYLRVALPTPVSVHPGEQLVVVLRMVSAEPTANLVVYGADAATTLLYGFHTGVWQPFGNVQLQVATWFVGGGSTASRAGSHLAPGERQM